MAVTFIKVLNMSISASWVVLIVLVLRLLLKKAPRWIHCCLWALVAVRLICPVSIESAMSLIPSTETVPEEIFYMESREQGEPAYVEIIEPRADTDAVEMKLDQSVGNMQTRHIKWYFLWPAGMAVMLTYAFVSYVRLKRKVSASIGLENGIFLCDYIDTPFILGIMAPKIYLPSDMDPSAAAHVLAHERAHIQRKDHWWKPLGFFLLTIHWFNPILWVAYVLLCRDIELACDEKVIRQMDAVDKKSYSEALLSCSVKRHMIAACPLAFGEVGVKERVKTVLNYKKPTFWIILIAILALIVTAVCFLTDPKTVSDDPFAEADSPYQWTRNMSTEFVEWMQVTAYHADGTQRHFSLDATEQAHLIDILNKLSEDEFELSNLSDQNTASCYVACNDGSGWDSSLDVNFLFDGDEVAMVFGTEEGVQRYKTANSKNWIIRNEELNGFFREYLDAPEREDPYAPADTPYQWTSNVTVEDVIPTLVVLEEETRYTYTPTDQQLNTLINTLNQVPEADIRIVNHDDVEWKYLGVQVLLCNEELQHIYLTLTDYGVMLETGSGAEDLYPGLVPEENWFIRSDALEQALRDLAYGGTYMLSDQNRQAVKKALDADFIQFFDPQVYGDLLFVGCIYGDDQTGLAVFESDGNGGYTLQRVTAYEYLNVCPDTSNVWLDRYIADGMNLYVFLNRNDILRQIQWTGEFETTVPAGNDPNLVIVDVPEDAKTEYRFVYGDGNATTMYMDWDNETHAQSQYDVANLDDPDDAYRVFSNLKLSQVDFIWATEILEVDNRYSQAYTYELTDAQIEKVMDLLRSVPEDAYEQAEFPREDVRTVDIFLTNDRGLVGGYPVLRLKIYQGAVYYQVIEDEGNTSQGWKINSPQLLEYLESFYDADISTWLRFAPVVKTEGEVIWSVDGVEITVPDLVCFEYDVSKEGIRFRPAGQEGWVLLQYRTEPYAPEELGLRRFNGMTGGKEVIRGCYGDADEWDFIDITIPAGDAELNVLLLNEEAASWVAEYDDEISCIVGQMDVVAEAFNG